MKSQSIQIIIVCNDIYICIYILATKTHTKGKKTNEHARGPKRKKELMEKGEGGEWEGTTF